ncbi:MAG TPA: DUF3089 domain-containing protein [Pseudomonadota bacterium]|nr:DUF3089 domain-containing protein [Pseudomonadota bacterium]
MHTQRGSVFFALSFLGACHSPALPTKVPSDLRAPFVGYKSETYQQRAMWLCRPDLPDSVCARDLSATEVMPDGSRQVVPHKPDPDPKVDCFYVYPTVDLSLSPANHTDFSDNTAQSRTVMVQAARLGEVCAVYAPLYRQVTIGTYFASEEKREQFLKTAFSDVYDAFLHYMGQHNQGRKVVLVGHSQGADMISRLLRAVFDQDPGMQTRLLVALPIGGPVEVPQGKLTGGSFANIPLCSRADETGCVVAFRTYRAGGDTSKAIFPPPPGHEPACVHPVEPGAQGARRLSRTYYPVDAETRKLLHGAEGITTPFVLYRNYYDAECMTGPTGYRYLGISTPAIPDDKRTAPVDLNHRQLNRSFGTHILDMQFSQGDLIELVRKRL